MSFLSNPEETNSKNWLQYEYHWINLTITSVKKSRRPVKNNKWAIIFWSSYVRPKQQAEVEFDRYKSEQPWVKREAVITGS